MKHYLVDDPERAIYIGRGTGLFVTADGLDYSGCIRISGASTTMRAAADFDKKLSKEIKRREEMLDSQFISAVKDIIWATFSNSASAEIRPEKACQKIDKYSDYCYRKYKLLLPR